MRFNYSLQIDLDGHIRLGKIRTTEMIAEFLTKPLGRSGIRKAIEAVQLIRTDGEIVSWKKALGTIGT